jgi:hypothetical protein
MGNTKIGETSNGVLLRKVLKRAVSSALFRATLIFLISDKLVCS